MRAMRAIERVCEQMDVEAHVAVVLVSCLVYVER